MDTEETQSNDADVQPAAAAGSESVPASSEPAEPAASPDRVKTEAAKAAEYWDRLLRVTADFENYKKRVARERQEASRYAFLPLLERLVPVLDHFEMALNAAQNAKDDALTAFHEGMSMIHQQLRTALTDSGLEEIHALGQPFDPNWHEAVSQQPTADVPEGQVTQELRKGYRYRDRLVRPARVVVAKHPKPEPVADTPSEAGPSET
jgi:molecular chaperone GrpE